MATAPKPKPAPARATKSGGPMPAKPAPKATEKPNAIEKLAQDITNRYRVTAREARDIVTAVSSAAQYRNSENGGTYRDLKGDILTQIKEVGIAAATGKKGTKPSQKIEGGGIGRVGGRNKPAK